MCLQNLMNFHHCLFKILKKNQNVTDGQKDGRADNAKTVYPPTNIVCGGYKYPPTIVCGGYKNADGMANSVDPDQTAPLGAV